MATQAIITNWRRLNNVDLILERLYAQTVPFAKIIVVDNADGKNRYTHLGLEDMGHDKPDIWRFPDNGYGPPCRFAPALVNWRYKYTFFIDDDILPGPEAHAHLLEAAELLHDDFATIGEVGRVYALNQPNYVYVRKDVLRLPERCTRVDLTCRAHFVRTANIKHAITMRDHLLAKFGAPQEGPDDWTRHDDILLCHGIQLYTDSCSYITHKGSDDTLIRAEDLPEPEAMWHRPGHVASRQDLINLTRQLGWEGLAIA
jgi:hypothetical protein